MVYVQVVNFVTIQEQENIIICQYLGKKTYKIIFNRCNNKNYNEFIYYGGRGIKCLINVEELKILWFRDKAYDMDRPSIDRIDNDGNYTFENCRFIELSENVKKNKFKPILQFDVDGNFIARFKSAREADRLTGISYKKNQFSIMRKTETNVWFYLEI